MLVETKLDRSLVKNARGEGIPKKERRGKLDEDLEQCGSMIWRKISESGDKRRRKSTG